MNMRLLHRLTLIGLVAVLSGTVCLTSINDAGSVSLPKAIEFLNLGLERFKQKDYQCAIAEYTRAIQISPKYAEAYNKRGLAYRELGDRLPI